MDSGAAAKSLSPASACGLCGNLFPFLAAERFGARRSALDAECHGRRVLTPLFRRGRPILDLTRSDLDDKLGGLAEIARSLSTLLAHEADYALPGQACKPETGVPYSN
ncbi:MAG: hypothetical protein WA791_10375 [Rhodomicrobium sp.]